MKKEELVKGLTYLGMAYGKEYTQVECEQYYDFLQPYSYDTFRLAIKNLIKTSKFLPKISELIEECDNCKDQSKFEILDYMSKQGYFKVQREFDKAVMFLETGIIPDWFREDMKTYYKMMKQEAISYQNKALLG